MKKRKVGIPLMSLGLGVIAFFAPTPGGGFCGDNAPREAPDLTGTRPVAEEKRISPGGRHVFTIEPEQGTVGWDVLLVIGSGRAVRLDMTVYSEDPKTNPFAQSWGSGGDDALRSSRVVPVGETMLGKLWVVVRAAEGSGKREAFYSLHARPLRGPVLGETGLVGDDARPLAIGTPAQRLFEYTDPPQPNTYQHAFFLGPPSGTSAGGAIVSLTPLQNGAPLDLSVFDNEGRRLGEPKETTEYQESLVGITANEKAFVVVRLGSPRTIFNKPSYSLAAVAADSPLPLTLGADPFLASGEGARQYELIVEKGRMAVIALEARGSRLSVRDLDRPDEEVPVVKSADGHVQTVFIGVPYARSSYVLGPLEKNVRLRVGVTADQRSGPSSSTRYKEPPWTLTLRRSQDREDYLLRIVSESVEGWGEPKGTKAGEASGGSIKIYSLDRQQRGTQQFVARLMTEDPIQALDIAICNRFGYALDIGNDTVRWFWTPDAGPLFLVVFPTPSSAASGSGKFEVKVSEVFSPSQMAK